MTISQESFDRLQSHWAVSAVGVERVAAAHKAATAMYVDANLGAQLKSAAGADHNASRLIEDVALAYVASPRYWVHPVLESGLFDPDSVDFAGHRGVGAPADRSVLGRCSVAQGRVPVPGIVLMLEVPDDHPGLQQGVPVVAVEALLA